MSTEPMSPERLAEIQAALDAIPAPPWRWIGTRHGGGPRLVTDHSGQQYILRAAKPADRRGDEVLDDDGCTVYGDLQFRDQRTGERYSTMRPGDQLAIGRTSYDPDSIVDVDNPVARWLKHSAAYAQELLAEIGWLAAEHADRTAELTTSAGVAEQAWKRNADMAQELLQLREQLAAPIWRAYYQGGGVDVEVGVGLFRTEAAAREACEDLLRCEDAAGAENATFDWIGDEDDPEELRELFVTFPDVDGASTGYCVVPRHVQDSYDPDADR